MIAKPHHEPPIFSERLIARAKHGADKILNDLQCRQIIGRDGGPRVGAIDIRPPRAVFAVEVERNMSYDPPPTFLPWRGTANLGLEQAKCRPVIASTVAIVCEVFFATATLAHAGCRARRLLR